MPANTTRNASDPRALALALLDKPRTSSDVGTLLALLHDYSLGNLFDAWSQCEARGIPFGRIATFKKWRTLGRLVRKGECAISLTVPRLCKKQEQDGDEEQTFVRFLYIPRFFVESQTDGTPLPERPLKQLDASDVIRSLQQQDEELGAKEPRNILVPAIAIAKLSVGLQHHAQEARYFVENLSERELWKVFHLADSILRNATGTPARTKSAE